MAMEEMNWHASDGATIFAREWKTEKTTAKAVVVLIHGLGEHAGRYAHVAAAMNAAGYAVLAPDLRGHGGSSGKRGHIDSYDRVLDDIQHAFNEASSRYPGLPQFLYGHSLGGALVLYYALKRKPAVRGIIVTSPGLVPGSPVPALKMTAAKIMNLIGPNLTLDNGLDLGNLSHDPQVKAAYIADKAVHPMISARLGIDFIRNGAWIQDQKGPFPVPLLLFQGTGDHIVNPQATCQFASGITGDITYREWEGKYHELHNEDCKQQVIAAMIDWLDRHL